MSIHNAAKDRTAGADAEARPQYTTKKFSRVDLGHLLSETLRRPLDLHAVTEAEEFGQETSVPAIHSQHHEDVAKCAQCVSHCWNKEVTWMQCQAEVLILAQDTSLVALHSTQEKHPLAVAMTTRPSRKSPSSLLSATMASSARTRSSSRLAKARTETTPAASAKVATPGSDADDTVPGAVAAAVALNASKDEPKPDSTDVALCADSLTVDAVEAIDGGEDALANSSPDATAGIPAVSTEDGNFDPTKLATSASPSSKKKVFESAGAAAPAPKDIPLVDDPNAAGTVAKTGAKTGAGTAAGAVAETATTTGAMPFESNVECNRASANASPPPKNLHSIFAAKTPSKSPPLTFTPLGKTRAASTKLSVHHGVAKTPTEAAVDTPVTVAVDTSPVAIDVNLSAGIATVANASGVDTPGHVGARGGATDHIDVASTQPVKDSSGDQAAKPASGIEGTPVGPAPADSTACQTGRKPGFQPAPEAPLAAHMQDPAAVTPSVFASEAPPASDDVAPVDRAGCANSVGWPRVPPTPTLGVPGASAITRIGTWPSDALGNTETRANTNDKSDIESASVSFKFPPTDNCDARLHGSDEALFQEAHEAGYRPSQFPPDIAPELFLEAQTAGHDHDEHFYMGGPAVFLQACQAGCNPDKHDEAGGPEVFLQAIAGGHDPIKDKCLQAFLRRWPEGRPEDPHTSDRPIHSVEDELSGEALRHAFNVGAVEGIVPCGVEAHAKQSESILFIPGRFYRETSHEMRMLGAN